MADGSQSHVKEEIPPGIDGVRNVGAIRLRGVANEN